MINTNIGREDLQSILIQLKQALHNHLQWHKGIVRTLACRLHSDKRDISPEAYRECLFGQWFYEFCPESLKEHPSYTAIGEAHKQMHQLTRHILEKSDAGSAITNYEFDNFANTVERLQIEINSLKRELEIALYTRDPLTGTVNRVDMIPILRELHEMTKRNSLICTLIFFDIDHFKQFNDKYGHPEGDKILATLSQYVMKHLRPYDKIFRYGGEEFLVCVQQSDIGEAYQRVEELREGIANLPIKLSSKEPVHITVSFGISLLDPTLTLEECIRRVDKAMYTAKLAGRNCIKIWNSDMDTPP